jgi:hypothetical protein
VNDHDVAIRVEAIAAELLGNDRVIRMPNPVMGAEDFSYILQQVPGVLAFLGTKPTDLPVDQVAGNHSNRMIIDESAMATGIAFYAEVARRTLATPYPGSRSCLIRLGWPRRPARSRDQPSMTARAFLGEHPPLGHCWSQPQS